MLLVGGFPQTGWALRNASDWRIFPGILYAVDLAEFM